MRWRLHLLSLMVLALALPRSARCQPQPSQPGAGMAAKLLPTTLGWDSAHPGIIEQLVFSADGKLLAELRDGAVQLWDVKKRQALALAQPAEDRDRVVSIAFSPDGKILATACRWNRTIHLWNAATGKQSGTLAGSQNSLLAFAPNGTLAASSVHFCYGRCGDLSGGDGTLRLWDVASGRELWQVEGVGSRSLALSPDGRALAVDRQASSLCLREARTGQERLECKAFRGSVASTCFSCDGYILATVGWDGAREEAVLRLWEVATGTELCAKKLPDLGPVVFLPDGQCAIGSARGQQPLSIWDPLSGTETTPLNGCIPAAVALALSADGKLLATGHRAGAVLLWDVDGLRAGHRPPAATRLVAQELRVLWEDLAAPDATSALPAMRALVAAPDQTVSLLRDRLTPVPHIERLRLNRLMADLESDRFLVRKQAGEGLQQLGAPAEPALQQRLAARPNLETHRRLEQLLQCLDNRQWAPTAEEFRCLRALMVLERLATPAARRLLTALAEGAPGARLTVAARGSLARLEQRH
jgi:WD40 repeat protein